MALARRSGKRFEANIWPGFVDAMTALLLVLVFVLSIFMIVQFMLRETITTQDTELEQLTDQVRTLAEALGLEQRRGFSLEQEVDRLDGALQERIAESEAQTILISSLTEQTELQERRIASFEEQVAGLLADRSDLRSRIASLTVSLDEADAAKNEATREVAALTARIEDIEAGLAREISEKEAVQLALAQARDEIDASAEAARLAAARREALQALIADLRAQTAAQSDELAQTNQALEAATLELSDTTKELTEAEAARLADAAAAEALRKRLESADAELTAMTLRLEEERKAAEETLTLLAAANAAQETLDAQLIAALAAGQQAKTDASKRQSELEADLARTRAALESERKSAEDAERDLLTQLTAAQSNSRDADATVKSLREELAIALAEQRAAREDAGTALTEAERQAALLATANRALQNEEAASAESRRQVEALNQQIAALRKQVGGLQSLLDDAAAKDVEADVQIAALGSQLNSALARVAAEERKRAALEAAERKRLEEEAKELKNYRSEFFGQLRALLGQQEGIRVVGDRFVFSSEVLFETGSADLSGAGRQEIAKVAAILREISDDIPDTLDWIIRVDGHTDNVPISGFGEFRDNWELSQGRALSVVRYMSESLGIPPERLAANGFGQYQPIANEDTPQARALNRRIELKLTER